MAPIEAFDIRGYRAWCMRNSTGPGVRALAAALLVGASTSCLGRVEGEREWMADDSVSGGPAAPAGGAGGASSAPPSTGSSGPLRFKRSVTPLANLFCSIATAVGAPADRRMSAGRSRGTTMMGAPPWPPWSWTVATRRR